MDREFLALLDQLQLTEIAAQHASVAVRLDPGKWSLTRSTAALTELQQAFERVASSRLMEQDSFARTRAFSWIASVGSQSDDWSDELPFVVENLRDLEWSERSAEPGRETAIQWDYGQFGWARAAVAIAGQRYPLWHASSVLNHPIHDMIAALERAVTGEHVAALSWVYWHEPNATIATLRVGSKDDWRLNLQEVDDWWPGRPPMGERYRPIADGPVSLKSIVNDAIAIVSRETPEDARWRRHDRPDHLNRQLEVLKSWRRFRNK